MISADLESSVSMSVNTALTFFDIARLMQLESLIAGRKVGAFSFEAFLKIGNALTAERNVQQAGLAPVALTLELNYHAAE